MDIWDSIKKKKIKGSVNSQNVYLTSKYTLQSKNLNYEIIYVDKN